MTDWNQALCSQTDPEVFFPPRGGTPKQAKDICARCEVRLECAEAGLRDLELTGIWGGLTHKERIRLAKQRRDQPAT